MKVKPFQPKFTSEKDFKVDPFNLNFDDQYWQENPEMGQELNFENLMENGCFQLLNEKLTAFATGRFEPPTPTPQYYYDAPNPLLTETKSKSKPSGVYHSDNGYMGCQGPFENSESSDSKSQSPSNKLYRF